MTDIEVGQVAMVPTTDIEIDSNRARKEMGDLDEMESTLKESGLITPLAVKCLSDGRYKLLAGERRFLVLQKNKVPTIPVRIYPEDISNIEMKSIELAENFYRKDFEFYEHDNLIREIHELQQEIHGTRAPGPSQTGWSTEDTAKMAGGISKASVSTAISRANARDAFPELFNSCKTQKDASNIIKKMDEAVVKDTIAQKLELNRQDSTLTQLTKCYITGDFFKEVKSIPDGVMHMVEIDPPYAINLSEAKIGEGESKYDLSEYNEIDVGEYQNFLYKTFQECYRVMTDHSWLICWFAPEPWFEVVYQELKNAGFNTTRMCGTWTKGYGQSKRPEIHLANSYEMFFYAWKGRPALNKAGRINNFDFSPVSPQQKTHPTERPVELMREIYDTFAFPGSRILIPFLGSGSGIIAANDLGMSAIGFELGKIYRDSFLIKVHKMKEE